MAEPIISDLSLGEKTRQICAAPPNKWRQLLAQYFPDADETIWETIRANYVPPEKRKTKRRQRSRSKRRTSQASRSAFLSQVYRPMVELVERVNDDSILITRSNCVEVIQ